MSPAETATAHALMTDTQVLEKLAVPGATCPFADGLLHELAEFQAALPVEERPGIVVQHGWTRPFHAWCDQAHRALISFGANGEPATDYATHLPDVTATDEDFVVVDGELRAAPAHVLALAEIGKQKRTMADIRSIATVFEAFHIDNDAWPSEPVKKLTPVVHIQPNVQPMYIRTLPLQDAWGHAFVFWTDGTSYRIVSPGRDGDFEVDYTLERGAGEIPPGYTDRDIVMADGEFEQWPAF